MKSAAPSHPTAVATTALIGAALLFGLMATLVKGAAARIPGPEVALVRFLIGLGGVGLVATRIQLRAHNWRGLFWRGAFGGGAVLCYFLTIEHLTVGTATLLNYTSPVFTALWAWLFLKERVSRGTLAALGVTTCGVGLVLMGNAPPGSFRIDHWSLVGILSAVLGGAAIATIREVRKTDGSWEIFAAFCLVGALLTVEPAVRHWVRPNFREWSELLGVGVLSIVAQVTLAWSMRWLPATVAGVLLQLTPVSALVLGRLVFDERPSHLALVGTVVTLLGVSGGAFLAAAPLRQRRLSGGTGCRYAGRS